MTTLVVSSNVEVKGEIVVFNVLAVRDGDEPPDFRYPVPGDQLDTVRFDASDGVVDQYGIASVRSERQSGRGVDDVLGVQKLSGALFVTDRRAVVASSSYAKGGGWIGFGAGGIAVAVAANMVSKARVARRIRGIMLVGQVRYEWLRHVTGIDRSSVFSHGALLFGLRGPDGGMIELTVGLLHTDSATDLAGDIARRAARYPEARAMKRISSGPGEATFLVSAPLSPGQGMESVDDISQQNRTDRARRLLLIHQL